MHKDRSGDIYGDWYILSKIDRQRYNARCSCGYVGIVWISSVRSGRSLNCKRCKYRKKINRAPWGNRRGYMVRNLETINGTRYELTEHRLVFEQHLGREIKEGESVHHINGIKNDNRIENLELFLVKQPYGQRPEDLLKWAYEIIERYS